MPLPCIFIKILVAPRFFFNIELQRFIVVTEKVTLPKTNVFGNTILDV